MFPWKEGVAALVALDGPEKNTIQYAPDGENFRNRFINSSSAGCTKGLIVQTLSQIQEMVVDFYGGFVISIQMVAEPLVRVF